jgi:hypothetical protein
MVGRLGIPPLDIIPGFQVKFLSDGIIDPDPTGALQDAFAPPFDPLQAQVHGPVPLTVVAVPAVQRFPVGAVETATPFAEPQTPLTGEALCSGALHEEFVPPLLPLHVQAQGPAPVTVVAMPAVQRPAVGAIVTATPFAEPQAPLTGVEATCSGALHEAYDPPLLPLHVQAQGPAPITVVAVPAVQRPVVGAVVAATPFAEPQAPLTVVGPTCGTPITPSPFKSCWKLGSSDSNATLDPDTTPIAFEV